MLGLGNAYPIIHCQHCQSMILIARLTELVFYFIF